MAWFPEPLHLHLYYISDVEVCAKLIDGVLILNDTTNSYVKWTVNPIVHVVFDKGLDHWVYLHLLHPLYMPINEGVLST